MYDYRRRMKIIFSVFQTGKVELVRFSVLLSLKVAVQRGSL
jgi:hypothetical protein